MRATSAPVTVPEPPVTITGMRTTPANYTAGTLGAIKVVSKMLTAQSAGM